LKIVVPGGIETHAVANVQPGARTLVPGVLNAGRLEPSLGGIWGGTTTVIDCAPVPHEGDLAQGIYDYLAPWRGQAYSRHSAPACPENLMLCTDLTFSAVLLTLDKQTSAPADTSS
jgi:hypothetical protein